MAEQAAEHMVFIIARPPFKKKNKKKNTYY